jgi:hypothetical protein
MVEKIRGNFGFPLFIGAMAQHVETGIEPDGIG